MSHELDNLSKKQDDCPECMPERTYTKAEVALERAAALREAAECTHTHGENATWKSGEASHRAILALIPQADAHALDKLLAEARLDQTEKIRRQWVECVRFGEWLTDELAALRASAGNVQP
jgi:hypothetical protein